MERSKILLWVLVFAMAGVIVWRVGFTGGESAPTGLEREAKGAPAAAGPNAPDGAEASESEEPNRPTDANAPTEPNEPNEPAKPEASEGGEEPAKADDEGAAEPNEPNEPGEQMEAVNLKDVEMKKIIDKIANWTGKTVIPHEEAMKQKITIYAPEKLPRAKALEKIYSALRMKNFVAEEVDDTIFLKPIADAKLGMVPTVGVNEPLAVFENKDKIVRKLFKLENYPTSQMAEVVKPLVGEYGYVSADETTGTLLVIDTVANLMSVQRIIAQFDVSGVGQAIEKFFEIEHGDPSEIVQLLRMLMGEAPTVSSRNRSSSRNRVSSSRRPSSRQPSRGGSQGSATSVVIGSGDVPLVLIPVPKARWVIARGAADDVKQIGEWIEKLDREEPVTSESETVPIKYGDPVEVAQRIEDALRDTPGSELTPNILVRPLEQSRQVLVIGRADLREIVKKMIEEIDIPTGVFETKVFELKHADADQIKTNLDNLYGEDIPRYEYYTYMRYGPGRNRSFADTVKVISFPTMGQVTVIASPENMRKIEGQIAEWDVPLDVDAVKPRIIELKNSDPVQMAELLTKLFTEEEDSSSSLIRLIFWGRSDDQRKKIVGPLYGQLTFEDVPGTKKIIVISKIPQAYDVVEELIYDLDRQEMAEIPNVVPLKYADPEDLAERLNAVFNEPGTTARIRRRITGLSEYSMDNSDDNQSSGSNNNNNNQNDGGSSNEYTPWWSAGARQRTDEEPISNVIGRVRFVPDPRSKSILVLAAPEFQASLEETIKKLDTPGKQVLVKAIVVEVKHESMTSLGIQLATNPDAFGSLSENAVQALGQLTNLATRGSAVANSDLGLGAEGTGTIVGGTTAVYGLIDFLIKTTNAKILNQQSLWTENNEEAMFFKGEVVPFLAGSTLSGVGTSQQDVTFEDVGMVLQVRPSITPEKHVDMMVRLQLSQLTADIVNSQPVRDKMETSTNMIVRDGETIMLGGMLFQTDSLINRKLPLLGDLPLVGGLFQHNDVELTNSEMIVFVTPFVVDDGTTMSEGAKAELKKSQEKLDGVRDRLDETAEELEDVKGND